MNETNYYYSDASNRPVGPVTLEQLRQLARDGVINNETNVIVEGTHDWVRYGDVLAGQQSSEVAAKIARQARNLGAVLGEFNWGAFLFGLLLVLLQFFILPYNLLKQAGATLSSWGKSKVLPTAHSDLPVLTFMVVVTRPAVHVIFSTVAFVVVCFTAYKTYGWGGKVGYFVMGLIVIYFANFAIGYAYDCLSAIVNIANSVKNIERKK
jgi:hypothetical protein